MALLAVLKSKLTAILVVIVLCGLALGLAYCQGRSDGKNSVTTNNHQITTEKLNEAAKATDAVTRCSRDPACLLSDDGHRRD